MPAENQKADPFGPNGTTYHVHLCVRGYLRDASKRELAGMFQRQDGTKLSADEAREYLMDCLAEGKEVLPLSQECEGFDYSGKGCPGHAKKPQP
ncbi:hypothetical protein D9M69_494460 [compost metagenome]